MNLHEDAINIPDPLFEVEVSCNNILVAPELMIRPANFGTSYTTVPFPLASAGAVVGPGANNSLTLKGIS